MAGRQFQPGYFLSVGFSGHSRKFPFMQEVQVSPGVSAIFIYFQQVSLIFSLSIIV